MSSYQLSFLAAPLWFLSHARGAVARDLQNGQSE